MIGINLFKHQKLSADISKDAFYSGKKLHLTTDPTGFGKTVLFTVLCKWLKKKEPDLQFIISAAQKEQVKEIADAFHKYTDLRTIVIPGGEDQMRYLVLTEEGREALENVKEASREYLNMAYAGEETNDFIEKRYNLRVRYIIQLLKQDAPEQRQTELPQHMLRFSHSQVTIHFDSSIA